MLVLHLMFQRENLMTISFQWQPVTLHEGMKVSTASLFLKKASIDLIRFDSARNISLMAVLKIEKTWPNTNVPFYFQWVTLFCFLDWFDWGMKCKPIYTCYEERDEGYHKPTRGQHWLSSFHLCISVERHALKWLLLLKWKWSAVE